ncbi:hypothetical protein L6452_01919 [Arctium lappa]|uniref:Uncharacterized protein n=1 Tax=Arctium lappa TaxID=4217 RepID=A0ACB9FI00_ARCLA|nr:hypothetical protein L6452_01919 [Arctium lappa]
MDILSASDEMKSMKLSTLKSSTIKFSVVKKQPLLDSGKNEEDEVKIASSSGLETLCQLFDTDGEEE